MLNRLRASILSAVFAGLTVCPIAAAGETARFLYIQNCGGMDLQGIHVEIRKEGKDADWIKSGRKWVQAPLLNNEAACFDASEMYGDVPEGAEARLLLDLGNGTELPCSSTTITKAKDGHLRVFSITGIDSYSDECRSRVYLDWQPRNQCDGQGVRISNIQCD